jgi:hypothetical protein
MAALLMCGVYAVASGMGRAARLHVLSVNVRESGKKVNPAIDLYNFV